MDYAFTDQRAIDRAIHEPESIGMPTAIYGSLVMKKLSEPGNRFASSSHNRHSGVSQTSPISVDMGAGGLLDESSPRSNTHNGATRREWDHSVRGLEHVPPLSQGLFSDAGRHPSRSDRDSLIASQKELMKAHQEILELEEEIRKARLR